MEAIRLKYKVGTKAFIIESREKAEHIIGIDKEIMVPAKRPLRSPHTYEW